jgi:DNA-binding MarR family transcriptional regulator
MPISTIRAQVDTEIARRVGTWFTVREIQDKLKINPSTLKPLIMKYARENVLRRRHVKGTARSVEFSPASGSMSAFQSLLLEAMPYRSAVTVRETQAMAKKGAKATSMKTAAKKVAKKTAKKAAKKATPKAKKAAKKK